MRLPTRQVTRAALLAAALLPPLAASPAAAQPARLLADLSDRAPDRLFLERLPPSAVVLDDVAYFQHDDGVTGPELWRSDGTADGTWRVRDVCPGRCWGWVQEITRVGDRLFFLADDGVHGWELWTSDGTAEGTRLVVDLVPGIAGSRPTWITAFGGRVFFSAEDRVHGREPWVSDGTPEGTVRLGDLAPGNASSVPCRTVTLGERLVFFADDRSHGMEAWITDGTPAGTTMLLDIRPGSASSAGPLHGPPFFPQIVAFGGKAFFAAADGIHGEELWMTDGTPSGTVLLADLDLGFGSGSPWDFIAAGRARRQARLRAGCQRARHRVVDDRRHRRRHGARARPPPRPGGRPRRLCAALAGDGRRRLPLFCRRRPRDRYRALGHRWDRTRHPPRRGRVAGAGMGRPAAVPDPSAGPARRQAALLPQPSGARDRAVDQRRHRSRHHRGARHLPRHILCTELRLPRNLLPDRRPGTNVLRRARHGSGPGPGVDVTRHPRFDAAGRAPGARIQRLRVQRAGRHPRPAPLGNHSHLRRPGAVDHDRGRRQRLAPGERARSGGASRLARRSGVLLGDGGDRLAAVGERRHGERHGLGRRPGGPVGPGGVRRAAVLLGEERHRCGALGDGRHAGRNRPGRRRRARAGERSSPPSHRERRTALLGRWRPGEAAALVADLVPGPGSSVPQEMAAADGLLYFAAFTPEHGVELWKSDGTAAGTARVQDVWPGAESSTPSSLTVSGRYLYFTADDGVHGREMWSLLLPTRRPRAFLITGGALSAGGRVVLTLRLENPPPEELLDGDGDELTLPLPAELRVVELTATTGEAAVIERAAGAASVGPRAAAAAAVGETVTWNGSLPPGGSVEVRIVAEVAAPPADGLTLQASGAFDSDGDGSNETGFVSDDPGLPGEDDATFLAFAVAIPAFGPAGAAILALALAFAGAVRLRHRAV